MMKKRIGVLLAAAMILGLVACGAEENTQEKEPETTEENAEDKDTGDAGQENQGTEEYETASLRAAYMPNMGGATLLVTAKEFGFFEKYGLDVELVEFGDGPGEVSAMASGDIDFAMIGHGAHALCAEGSAVVIYPDAIGLSSAIIANKDRGISSLEDLRGKKVAYVAGTASEELLKLALSKADMTIDDVEAVNFDVAGMVTAMASGQVDAAASSAPYTTTIKNQLGEDFLQLCEDRDYLEERTLMNSEVVTAKFAQENPDLVLRIAKALAEAADYRAEHIEEVAVLVAKQCQGDEETFLELVDECIWLTGKEVSQYAEDGTLATYYENAQKAFVESGRLAESVPVEDYVLFDVIQEACSQVYGS